MGKEIFILETHRALLLCSGVVDVFDFGQDYGEDVAFVIKAASVTDKESMEPMPGDEWVLEYLCGEILGIVPCDPYMYDGKNIGLVYAHRSPEDYGKLWTKGSRSPETCYRIDDAMFLQNDVTLTKFRGETTIRNAYRAMLPERVGDNKVVIPLNAYFFGNRAHEGGYFGIPLGNVLRRVLYDGEKLAKVPVIEFVCGNRVKHFETSDKSGVLHYTPSSVEFFAFHTLTLRPSGTLPFFHFRLDRQL